MDKSPVIRLTKEFRFEAAHALWNYDGPCRNIHGHSYILYVTVKGHPETGAEAPKQGMLIDFSILKQIVKKHIIDVFDHALLVNGNTPHAEMAKEMKMTGKLTAVPYQPTCENMIHDFAGRIKNALPEGVELFSLRLHETASSYAEWFAADN